ncbi:MAG: hypothetical protein ABI743_02690 [bacterium]
MTPSISSAALVLGGVLLAMSAAPASAGPEAASELFSLAPTAVPGLVHTGWNDGILATTFAERGKPTSGLGHRLDGQHDLFVALPAVTDGLPCLTGHLMRRDRTAGTITCRVVELRPHGLESPVVTAPVEDIGPWDTADPYWTTGVRPNAEDGVDSRGRHTNGAGIDISPALLHALGLSATGKVDWRWATDANGQIVTVTRKVSFSD